MQHIQVLLFEIFWNVFWIISTSVWLNLQIQNPHIQLQSSLTLTMFFDLRPLLLVINTAKLTIFWLIFSWYTSLYHLISNRYILILDTSLVNYIQLAWCFYICFSAVKNL